MGKTISISPAKARSARRFVELAEKWGKPVPPAIGAMAKAPMTRHPRDKHQAVEDFNRLIEAQRQSVVELLNYQDDDGKTWFVPLVSHYRKIRGENPAASDERVGSVEFRTSVQEPLEELQAVARESGHAVAADPDLLTRLTEREVQVLRLMVAGATKEEIAEQLDIADYTVDVYMRGLAQKLGEPSSQIRESDTTRPS